MKIHNRFIHKFSSYVLVLLVSFSLFAGTLEKPVFAEPDAAVDASADSSADTDGQSPAATWPASPEIFAETGVLIEASTGTVLYDKSCHQQMYPASITKIMTTLLALENGNLSDTVEFYHYDVYSLEYGDAGIARQEGEFLTLKDTLYAVMLASANECANAAGEFVARKTDAFKNRISELQSSGEDYNEDKVAIAVFADMMNERAKEVGALGTHFSNPNGLFSEDHYTTAYDMAMIMREAINNEEFLKIEENTSYTIPATNKNPEAHTVYQRHKMAFVNGQNYYEGFIGGKTGYVDQSGTTLVTSAKRNGMTLISVVMRSNGENVYNDTRLLLDYGFNNFSLSNIAENETRFSLSGLGGLTNLNSVFDTNPALLEISSQGNVILPNGASFSDCTSELSFDDVDSSDTSSSSTNKIAVINYYYNGANVGKADLLFNKSDFTFTFGPTKEVETEKPVKKDNYININIWFLLGGIFIVLIIIAVIYYTRVFQHWTRIKRRNRRRHSRNSYYGSSRKKRGRRF